MTADELGSRIPASALRWLRLVCVLGYATGVAAVVLGLIFDSKPALVIAVVLLLAGLCSMATCCISTGSQSRPPPTTTAAAGMRGTPGAWLFKDDAREELDRAIAESKRAQGSLPKSEPAVMERTIVGEGSSKPAGTMVCVDDVDGWWDEYARVHGWPKYTTARMREFKEERKSDSSDSQ